MADAIYDVTCVELRKVERREMGEWMVDTSAHAVGAQDTRTQRERPAQQTGGVNSRCRDSELTYRINLI